MTISEAILILNECFDSSNINPAGCPGFPCIHHYLGKEDGCKGREIWAKWLAKAI